MRNVGLWQQAAELPDYDAEPMRNVRLHCTKCGGFLPQAAYAQGFDHEMQVYWEARICKRCGKSNEWAE